MACHVVRTDICVSGLIGVHTTAAAAVVACGLLTYRLALEVWKIRSEVLWDSAIVSRQAWLLLLNPSDWWALQC